MLPKSQAKILQTNAISGLRNLIKQLLFNVLLLANDVAFFIFSLYVIFQTSYTQYYPAKSLREIHRSFHSVVDLNSLCRLLQIYSVPAPKKLNTRTIKKQTDKLGHEKVRREFDKHLATKNLPSIGHMVSGSECHQMCIIGRGWHGDTTSAPCIYVTQLISELLKAVGCEGVIVVQNVIVCGSACSLG